jgi:hypothetical protein
MPLRAMHTYALRGCGALQPEPEMSNDSSHEYNERMPEPALIGPCRTERTDTEAPTFRLQKVASDACSND